MSREACYVPRGATLSRLTVDAGLLHPSDAAEASALRSGIGGGLAPAGVHQSGLSSSSVHSQTLGLGHALMAAHSGHGGSSGHGGQHGSAGGGPPGSMLGSLRAPSGVHSSLGGHPVAGIGALMDDIRPLIDFDDPPPLSGLGFSAGNTLGGGTGAGNAKPVMPTPLNPSANGSGARQLPGRLPVGSRRRTGATGAVEVVSEGDGGGYWGGRLNAAVASSFGGRPGPSSYGGFSPSAGVAISSLQQRQQQHEATLSGNALLASTNGANSNSNHGQQQEPQSSTSSQPPVASKNEEGRPSGGLVNHGSSAPLNLLSELPSSPTIGGIPVGGKVGVRGLPPPPPILGGRSLLGLLGAASSSVATSGGSSFNGGGGGKSVRQGGSGLLVSSTGETLYCDGHWNELGLPLPLE